MTTPNQFSCEQFNLHQADNRKRTEFIGKSVFLLSGGALTFSIGIFLRKGAPTITEHMLPWLYASWISLFSSIVFYVIVFGIMVLRDYNLGEQWRKKLHNKKDKLDDSPGWPDKIMWILASVAIAAFIFGFASLCCVACNTLKNTNLSHIKETSQSELSESQGHDTISRKKLYRGRDASYPSHPAQIRM